MTISLKVIMYLMAAGVGLSSVRGHKGGRENVTDLNDTTTLAENYSLGRNGHFECHYPDSHESNDKFLCKGSSLLNCNWWINATEQEKDVHKGKFHIRDNRRKKYFYVDIGSLSRDDSGTYWCGSSSTAAHVYTKFLLSVTERTEHRHTTRRPDPDPPAVQTTESFKGRDVLHPDPTAVGLVCLELLLIVVLVVILCKHRHTRRQGGSSEQRRNDEHDTEDDPGDHQYEEIRMLGQQTRPADAPLSVYATVNRPADELHYASVTFQQHRAVVPAEEGGGGGGGRPFAC
ncbi:CMRF35-like molecule 8 isoform X1 [Gasterosteus aculeatus]